MDYIVAVVPVRKNSQRVKNKNFKNFVGKNLLIHKIITLKKLRFLDKIIINTDFKIAINIAKENNVSYHLRDKYFSSSKCLNSDFWQHIAFVTNAKYIMFTNCTSPLVKFSTYVKFYNFFKKNCSKYDSFNTVTSLKEFIYFKNKAMNFNPNKAPNSQNLKEILKINFAINIISKKIMYKKKSLIGNNPYFFPLSEIEGYDVNYPFEFEYAEYLFKKFYLK